MPLQVVGLGDPEVPAALVHAPLALAPVPFPREAFQRAKRAATVRTDTLCPLSVGGCTQGTPCEEIVLWSVGLHLVIRSRNRAGTPKCLRVLAMHLALHGLSTVQS